MDPKRLMSFALLALVLLTWGCVPKDTCSVVCQNGGTCLQKKCVCPTGYEGEFCETESRKSVMGNWKVYEDGSMTVLAKYPTSVEALTGGTLSDVQLINFYNYFQTPVKAHLAGDTLYIPEQQLEGKKVIGKGWIHKDSILMMYKVTDSATNQVNDFGFDASPANDRRSVWYR